MKRTEITFAEVVENGALGRNGTSHAAGIILEPMHNDFVLRPVNTTGGVAGAYISVPYDSAGEVGLAMVEAYLARARPEQATALQEQLKALFAPTQQLVGNIPADEDDIHPSLAINCHRVSLGDDINVYEIRSVMILPDLSTVYDYTYLETPNILDGMSASVRLAELVTSSSKLTSIVEKAALDGLPTTVDNHSIDAKLIRRLVPPLSGDQAVEPQTGVSTGVATGLKLSYKNLRTRGFLFDYRLTVERHDDVFDFDVMSVPDFKTLDDKSIMGCFWDAVVEDGDDSIIKALQGAIEAGEKVTLNAKMVPVSVLAAVAASREESAIRMWARCP